MAGEHGQLTTSEGIHIAYQWSYADASARTGATGFVAADVGKEARQLNDDSKWMLTATTPTWVQTGGGSGGGAFVRVDGTVAMTGSLDVGDNNITNVGNIALDSISEDGTGINVTLGSGAGNDFNVDGGKLLVEGDTGYVTTTGKLGVGTTTFTTRDKLIVDNGSTDFLVGLTAKTVSTQTGTGNSPVAILANNTNTLNAGIGLRFSAKNGSGTDDVNLAQIFAIIEQASAGAVNHGGLRFTTTDGSGVVNAMAISKNGYVGIGISSPSAQLHIDQSSATGAQPVLYLDQADVSEEMIEFNTTIGTGNAIEAVGAKTLTTTHFIKITITGVGTRYIPVGTIA